MKILITGSTGGIGSNICEHLEKNNIEVIKLQLDLSEDFDLNIDNIDGLIHCAGINYLSSFKGINYENFNKILQVNSISFIKLCQKVKFNKKANIIAIGSLYATSVKPDRMMYSFSKHALLAVVKTLALEMSNDKIKVNMISPGFVNTPLTRKNNTQTRIDQLDSIIPLGLTDADEIAKMCLYLLKENKAITGQNLIIDGGYSCLEI
jgi:NAD(P)-dependent dehydrogenase (short-subunit alcohol dehydrogenase family)